MAKQTVGSWRKFLCVFAQVYPDFRIQELESLASLVGSEVLYESTSYSNGNPYLVVQFQSEEVVKKILSRSFLIKSILELWGWGRNYDELKTSIEKNVSRKSMEPYIRTDYTYRLIGTGFSRKFSMERQQAIFKSLSYLPFNGKVDLKKPHHTFYVLEDYGDFPNKAPEEPLRVFFGRHIGCGSREIISRFSVKKRHFIGGTSMDAHLAFLMANQGKVRDGHLVLDPFVGSGSILVSCAYLGGHVLGSDIDWNMVHGKGCTSRAHAPKQRGQDENVRANLRQYGLEDKYLDMLVTDAARTVWRDQELFDSIITDPPYGIREGGKKIGSKSLSKPVPPEFIDQHYPEVQSYKLSELFADLVRFAARFLSVGGRLVYWIPVVKMDLTVLPSHPCLQPVACSLQPLQRHVGRRLITMEKRLSWADYQSQLGQEQDKMSLEEDISKLTVHDNFRDKYFSEDGHVT